MSEVVDLFRAANVALALATAVLLWVRINDDWHHLSKGFRVVVTGQVLFPLVACYGSAEAYLQDAVTGIRPLFVTAACLVILVGLWLTRDEPPPKPTIPARDLLDVLDGVDVQEAGVPCTDPGCIGARIKLRQLVAEAS